MVDFPLLQVVAKRDEAAIIRIETGDRSMLNKLVTQSKFLIQSSAQFMDSDLGADVAVACRSDGVQNKKAVTAHISGFSEIF
jgi:hypothetical protein